MTALLQSLRRIICQLDLFCSSELLRYRSQGQYKTLTGGLLSLAIISAVAVGFGSMVADTLQREIITSTLTTQRQTSPSFSQIHPGSEGMFMLGFSIQSFDVSFQANLSEGPQYFSFRATIQNTTDGVNTTESQVFLQQCTQNHWSIVPGFEEYYEDFGVANWLCLPLGSTLPLQGSYISSVYSYIMIEVLICQNTTSHNTCAPQEDIDALFDQHRNFYLTFNYVNPVINPNQQNSISYYVQGNDYIVFSSQIGVQAWIQFSDYTVTTDDSILPYKHTISTIGCIVEEKAITHPYAILGKESLAWIYLAKSGNSLRYHRQVQKISAVFSYIGGLIGAITAVLFLIKSYTDTSLEIAIGLSLFQVNKKKQSQQMEKDDERSEESNKSKDQKKEKFKRFNFCLYVRLMCYRLLRFFGWIQSSQKEEYLHECQQQALRQMDIQMLLKRMIKLEACMSRIFTAQQLQQIRESQHITIKCARRMRTLLLKEDEICQVGASKIGQIKDQMQLKDVVIEQNSVSEGQSHVQSANCMHEDHQHMSKTSSMSDKQQEQHHNDALSRFLEGKKLKPFTFSPKNSHQANSFSHLLQGGNKNRINPSSLLPPLEHTRIIQYSSNIPKSQA